MIGAELMAEAVRRQGVNTVFGLPGHLESFFGALQDRKMRLIHMRHEAAVVLAADGYARTRCGVGFACVTAGPGLANAVGGLATSFEACVPLVVFAGRNPLNTVDSATFQDFDHTRAVRQMTKWAATVYSPSRLGEYIDRACRTALSGRPGPVLLEIPREVAEGAVNGDVASDSLRPLLPQRRPLAGEEAVGRAADLLAEAERPLIIAGNGAYWGNAGPGLRKLMRDFRLPVLSKGLARGLVPEDMKLGFPWPVAYPASHQSDVVLIAGARMGHPIGYAAPPLFHEKARYIQIDIDGTEIGRNRYVEAPVVGDCGPALERIAEALDRRGYSFRDPGWLIPVLQERLDRIAEVGRENDGQSHPLKMARELAIRMPDDAIFVGDGANCLNWYKAVIPVKAAPGWIDQDPFGSMGVGLPLAIGVVAAEQEKGSNRPVFLGTGDGALGQYLGELATASLHGLSFFIMVANDGYWGASRNITLRLFGDTYGTNLNQSRDDLVAEGLECRGELAATPAEVGPSFDRALAAVRAGKPALVNVLVDPKSGDLREDPRLQMVSFNSNWFTYRSGAK